jgi:carbamoyltransferase
MKILGISLGHDSGASIFKDDAVKVAINEERLSRKKLHIGYPYLSIEKILEISNTKISEIDIITIDGKKIDPQNFGNELNFENIQKKILGVLNLDKFILGTEIGVSFIRFLYNFKNQYEKFKIKKKFIQNGFKGEFKSIEHHYAHAASAYFSQEKDVGLAITLDGGGEGYCSHIYKAEKNKLSLLHKITTYHSLPLYYAYITKLIGFTPLRHEGKLLGLAASGNPEKVEKILDNYIRFDKNNLQFKNIGGYYFKVLNKLKKDLSNISREDIAAGIQAHSERLTIEYISAIIKKFSFNKKINIFLAGGIFANIKINQKISEIDLVESCYIFPNMGDGGLSTGAVLAEYFSNNKKNKKIKIDMYLGSSCEQIDNETLLSSKLKILEVENIYSFIAKELKIGKIFGIFQGKMEFGPRALGNRSIICSPKKIEINEILNQKLKRSDFMPFAPCVLAEDFEIYFQSKLGVEDFKFMTFTCKTKEICDVVAPAIVHIDKTARPQTIFKKDNDFLYNVLSEFKKETGLGMLINTSFNVHEEPIVESYHDAIKSFKESKLDYLILDKKIIKSLV